MSLKGTQIIDASFSSFGKDRFTAVNPATEATLEPQFYVANREDVDNAVKVANNAFHPYRNLPLVKRASFLESIGEQLMALGTALISRAHEETALALPRLEGELARTVNQLNLFAEQIRKGACARARIDRAQPERTPMPKPDIRTMQVSLGPVAVFGASNFPLAFSVAGGDTASALAAGCPVVVKAHSAHPGTSELAGQAVMQAIREHQIPAGVFSLLQSPGTDVGEALVQHPLVKAVAFTGSLAGGRALFNLACARPEPIPVYAEMGSINPIFLLPQRVASQGDSLVEGLAESITLGVGQFCTAPGLMLMVKGVETEEFINQLASCLAAKPPGVLLHQGIKQNFLAGLQQVSLIDGVEPCGQLYSELDGCLVTPALLQTNAKTYLNNPALTEELFGPAAVVVLCESKDEMLAVADSLQGQLTASVHATDGELVGFPDLLTVLECKAGRLVMNAFPTGVEVCAAMNHGGPYPATTDSKSTSVGSEAMQRFLRPVCYQGFSQGLLPVALRDENVEQVWRLVDGQMNRNDL